MPNKQIFLSDSALENVRVQRVTKVGISGAGFVARGISNLIGSLPDFEVVSVLSRRPVDQSASFFPEGTMTNSMDELIEKSEIVLECSGDAVHAANVLVAAGDAGRKLMTMNCEAQITIGSSLVRKGYSITECHGDQPGCFAELLQEALDISFQPLVYVNLKGFLNLDPPREDMEYWSNKQRVSIRQTTAFTDGSKLQLEQALVANGLDAKIAKQGLIGGTIGGLGDLDYLAEAALDLGAPISDYAVYPGGPPGVVLLGTSEQADLYDTFMAITKLKTKGNKAYVLLKPYHLVHLEVAKTLRQVVRGDKPLLTNGHTPYATVCAVAKRDLPAGTVFDEAMGGFDVRGEAIEVEGNEDVAPITLMDGARLKNSVQAGQVIRYSDVDIDDSLALDMYRASVETPFKGEAAA